MSATIWAKKADNRNRSCPTWFVFFPKSDKHQLHLTLKFAAGSQDEAISEAQEWVAERGGVDAVLDLMAVRKLRESKGARFA